MASWNKITAGDTLYDVRRQNNGMHSELAVWPVDVISMDAVTETAVIRWNHNRPMTVNRKQLEKFRVKQPIRRP